MELAQPIYPNLSRKLAPVRPVKSQMNDRTQSRAIRKDDSGDCPSEGTETEETVIPWLPTTIAAMASDLDRW